MKARPAMFLSEANIDQQGEIFDYIRELHEYLWRFVRVVQPGVSGDLCVFLDTAINKAEMICDILNDVEMKDERIQQG